MDALTFPKWSAYDQFGPQSRVRTYYMSEFSESDLLGNQSHASNLANHSVSQIGSMALFSALMQTSVDDRGVGGKKDAKRRAKSWFIPHHSLTCNRIETSAFGGTVSVSVEKQRITTRFRRIVFAKSWRVRKKMSSITRNISILLSERRQTRRWRRRSPWSWASSTRTSSCWRSSSRSSTARSNSTSKDPRSELANLGWEREQYNRQSLRY